MNELSLIEPSVEMAAALPMINEIGPDDGGFHGLDYTLTPDAFGAYVTGLNNMAAGRKLPEGWVPMNTYWLVRGGTYPVGVSQLRHRLTDSLLKRGGHIAYWIRPGQRRKGYGTLLFTLTCQKAKVMGIGRVLVTCHRDNEGSIRIIEKNGGILDTSLSLDPQDEELHYWIQTSSA
jgi:predicted acetyltransferase